MAVHVLYVHDHNLLMHLANGRNLIRGDLPQPQGTRQQDGVGALFRRRGRAWTYREANTLESQKVKLTLATVTKAGMVVWPLPADVKDQASLCPELWI